MNAFNYQLGDTICALATAPLPAGVGVIRISGPDAFTAAEILSVPTRALTPRRASLRALRTANGPVLDHAMVLLFPGPASFTGEDVVELHTHGSPAVIAAVLEVLTGIPGVRQALPGEFTRRAVLNAKMDLTQAEGLADLIAATTQAQHRQALRQLDGALGHRFESWRARTLELLAQTEAAIDFPDEELDVLSEGALADKLKALMNDLTRAVAEKAGERVRDGLHLAILGKPNAGKSTLLNLLSGRDVAIVSPLAGTTRDVVTSRLDLAGFPVTLADTAGLRATEDAIEKEGIRRAQQQADQADLLIILAEASEFPALAPELREKLQPGRTLIILSKPDLLDDFDAPRTADIDGETYPLLSANLTEDAALTRILPALESLVRAQAGAATEAALLTRSRHRQAVESALGSLGRALLHLQKPAAHGPTVAELMAQDLRDAAAAIGTVTGRTGTEDVLDLVFSTFCIGK